MAELLYPELSQNLIGILFDAYNNLGGGYQEKVYQAAIRKELSKNKIKFIEQIGMDLLYKGNKISRYYLDFIIENKIVLELKVTPQFTPKDIMQVLGYLKQTGLELGILVSMNRNGVIYKRILRGKSQNVYFFEFA